MFVGDDIWRRFGMAKRLRHPDSACVRSVNVASWLGPVWLGWAWAAGPLRIACLLLWLLLAAAAGATQRILVRLKGREKRRDLHPWQAWVASRPLAQGLQRR